MVSYSLYSDDTMSITVSDSAKRLLEVYKRYDDNSYVFTGYDKNQTQSRSGLLKLSNEIQRADTFQMMDYSKDPTGIKGLMKDTVLYTYKYLKQGLWIEPDSLGDVWQGYYENGMRNYRWKKGYLKQRSGFENSDADLFNNFFLRSIHYFDDGIEIPNDHLKSFWPAIKGIWLRKCCPSDIDSVSLILRKETYIHPSFLLEFTTDSTYRGSQKCKNATYSDCTEFYSGKWFQQGDKLLLEVDNKRATVLLLDLTKYEMTVRFIDP
ncbi:MAG: hypothetical protein V4722_18340 [Bacteroidota bacterium]